jgi:hypothetical protein
MSMGATVEGILAGRWELYVLRRERQPDVVVGHDGAGELVLRATADAPGPTLCVRGD